MLLADFVSTSSFAFTWLGQSTCAFLVVWCLCRVLRAPRAKVWLWSLFIGAVVLTWAAGWQRTIFPKRSTVPADSAVASATSDAGRTGSGGPSQVSVPLVHRTPAWSFELKRDPRLDRLAFWAGRGYLVFALLLLFHWIVQAYRLRSLLSDSEEAPPELAADFSRLCRELNIRRFRLRTIASLHSPATAYWLRPVVLLPFELTSQVTRGQLTDMLRHELIHVRHRDFLWEQLASVACRILFFHPAVWIAAGDLRRQRELACDHEAAGITVEDRLRYADSLLSFARWKRNKNNPVLALEFASQASPLSIRVHSLLRPPVNPHRQNLHTIALSGVALALVLAVVPAVSIGFTWSVEKVVAALPGMEKAIVELAPLPVVQKARRAEVVSLRRVDVPPEALPTLPDTQQLASVTSRLAVPVVPAVQARVSLSALAKAQLGMPSYAASSDLRKQSEQRAQAQWVSAPGTTTHKEEKQLGKLQKTAISAAVYSLTYLTHEATETEGIVYGKH